MADITPTVSQQHIPGPTEARYASDTQPSQAYIVLPAVVGVSLLGVLAILGIEFLRPAQDNMALITIILAFLAPTALSLMALLQGKDTHQLFNSRMTQLLQQTSISAHAEGITVGIMQQKETEQGKINERASAAQRVAAAEALAAANVLETARLTATQALPAAPASSPLDALSSPQVVKAVYAAACTIQKDREEEKK